MLCSANLVAQWFSRKRGFALSLMALGFSASIAVHPPLAQWLIDQVGWREAWLWLGLITWALRAAADRAADPEQARGPRPRAGRRAPRTGGGDGPVAHAARADVGLTVGQALRTPAFWIIALSFATFSMLVTGLFFHQVAIFNNRGISPQAAA